jgi:iron complex outermembrane recepter protein
VRPLVRALARICELAPQLCVLGVAVASSLARADDAQLWRYIAEAEARADARPETIVVDGEAPVDTPSAGVRVVDARELELTPRKNTDDLLRVVPGLYTSQHGSEGKGQQFFLRGFDAVHGADLAIRVAGIPINELSNVHGQGYADLGFVIPETVAGLVARKGPFDLEQGWFATAGSLELALGTPRRGKRIGYELGTTNRHRLVVIDAPEGAPDGELVAVEAMHDDGYGETRGSEHVTALAQTELAAGRLRLRPLLVGYFARFGEPGVVPLDDIRSGYFDRMAAPAGALGGRSQRLLTGIGGAWARDRDEVVGSAHLGWRGLALTENFTGFLESPEHGDARDQRHRAVTGGGRIAWRHRVSASLRVLAGAEVIRDQLRQVEDRVATTGMVWRHERALEATTTTAGAWAGVEARSGRWTATGGLRGDALAVDALDRLDPARSGRGSAGAASPRIAIAWRGEAFAVSAAAGRGVRPPEARAFTRRESREGKNTTVYDGGDPSITVADAAELGGEWKRARLTLGATGFATWIDRESIFDHVSGVNITRDGSRRMGTELYAVATPVPWLALRGDVSLVDARFIASGNPVPGAPRLLATAEARVDRAPWSAGLAGRFLGARPLAHGAMAASATVVDAVGAWARGRWLFALQIDNLLARDWNEGEYHFASRWDLSAPPSDLPRVHISPGRPFGVRAGATLQF